MNPFGPITPTFFEGTSEMAKKVILFDPTSIYTRATFNKFSRHPSIGMEVIFDQPDKTICSCGCGVKLTGRQRRWASESCSRFAAHIFIILRGDTDRIRMFMQYYLPHECVICKCEDYSIETTNGPVTGLHVEHILAVKNGGGGCWLGNYQFMCHRCHREKTNADRLVRTKQSPMPISKEW